MGIKRNDRLSLSIPHETKQRLVAYAAARGQSQGSIVDAALREYLDDNVQATLVLRELGRMRRGVARLEQQASISDVVLKGFITMWLAHNPSLPKNQEEQASSQASLRMDEFIKYVRQQLSQQQGFKAFVSNDDLFSDAHLDEMMELLHADGNSD